MATKTKSKECVCDEMSQKVLFFESWVFECPKHGTVTVDRRQVFPVTIPIAPAPTVPSPWPYTGDPTPWEPNIVIGGTTLQ